MHHFRWRRAALAAVASLCASAAVATSAQAAQGDLPRITQNAPTGISLNYWDDHSIGGDDHLGWGHESSQGEPLAISFQASVDNDGPGVLQLCSGTGTTWRTARQTAPAALGDCSGASVNTEDLFFRYAIANHSPANDYNRWHTMDFQRFALVPLTANGQNADTSRPTLWDNQWGTCLLDDDGMACPQTQNAAPFGVGISAGTQGKLTQEGAPDQAVIAFRSIEMLAEGTNRYQLVAIANPYGAIAEAGTTSGSVNCTNVTITTNHAAGTFSVGATTAAATCFLPRNLQSAVSGDGGVDPFAGAAADEPCLLHTAAEVTDPDTQGPGHCWLVIPTTNSGLANPHTAARSNVTDARVQAPTNAIAVAPGSAVRSTGGGNDNGGGNDTGGGSNGGGTSNGTGGGRTPTPPVIVNPPARTPPVIIANPPLTVPTLQARKARSYTRSALRKTFGVLPSSAKVSCKLTGGASASCKASWRRPHGRGYSGTIKVWFTSTATRVHWNYSVDVKRKQRGHRTATIKRTARVGGSLS